MMVAQWVGPQLARGLFPMMEFQFIAVSECFVDDQSVLTDHLVRLEPESMIPRDWPEWPTRSPTAS